MNKPLDHKITLQQLAAVDQNIESATGMPNAAYTDPEFFAFEREHVLGSSWTALMFCVDYKEDNVVTPIEFMGLPLIVTKTKSDKNQQGALKIFHNVCSHRGRRLVNEKKETNGMVVCPYHCWSYDLNGKLCATPHIGGVGIHQAEGFQPEKNGLKEIRSHIWLGVLFINLSGDAPEFEDYAKPMLDRYRGLVGEHDASQIEYTDSHGQMSFSINCNWKLAMENFCESYHLPWIHPSLNSYSPLEEHHHLIINENFSGQRSTKFNPDLSGCESFPRFNSWPRDQLGCAEYPAFYPNVMFGFQENHLFIAIVYPIDVDKTDEDMRLIYVNQEAAKGSKFETARIANHAAWQKIFSEDVTSVEGMQQGRLSPGYTGGAFSPVQDVPTLHFHQWIARKYRASYRINS